MVIDPYSGYDYNYSYDFSDIGSFAGILFLVVMGIYALTILYSIVAYVLESLGMYTIAQRRGIKHPWLAWIPYGNVWILGSIADQYQYVSMGQVKNRRKVLLGLQIANTVLGLGIFCVYVKMIVDMLIASGGNLELVDPTSVGIMVVVILLLALVIYVLAVIAVVFYYISLYNLFASCWPGCKVAFILLSLFLGFTRPFLVFACRKKDLGMPPRKPKSAFEVPVEAIPQPVAAPVAAPVAEPVAAPAAEPEAEPAAEVPEEPAVEAEPAVEEAPAPEETPATEE